MPVEDKPVHERTRKLSGSTNGCHSDKYPHRADGYWAPDGSATNDGHSKALKRLAAPLQVWVPYRFTVSCQYDMRDTDDGCKGCVK